MGLTRRGFLGIAGAGVATAALGVPSAAAGGRSAGVAGSMDWNALARKLSGRLLRPGDAGYDTAKLAYNPLFDGHVPGAVAQVNSVADVQECVRAAAASHTVIAGRSGGHSYAGYSVPTNGLVVDLGRLNGVRAHSDGTAVVGAGARLGDVYERLAKAGRAIGGGSCPTVGISGLTLGGGVGVLTRKLGLTCDQVRSMRVVTADGRLRTASATSEPELFWALRGGGGGNLGIVTEFTFATVPAPTLTVLSLHFPAGAVASVFDGWQRWLPKAQDEFWTTCSMTGDMIKIVGCFYGSQTALAAPLKALLAALRVAPSEKFVEQKTYAEAMDFFAGSTARQGFRASSRILRAAFDANKVAHIAASQPTVTMLVDALGGAAGRVEPTATPFPHRKALATVQLYGSATPANSAHVGAKVARMRDQLGVLMGDYGYVNYLDKSQPGWGNAYYGANLTRLHAASHRYDPHSVFGFAQSLANA